MLDQGGDQTGEWGNKAFIDENIRGHDPEAGDAFPVAEWPKGRLKEGDSPSMLYLLAPVLGNLGDVWLRIGRFERAAPLLEEAIAIAREGEKLGLLTYGYATYQKLAPVMETWLEKGLAWPES